MIDDIITDQGHDNPIEPQVDPVEPQVGPVDVGEGFLVHFSIMWHAVYGLGRYFIPCIILKLFKLIFHYLCMLNNG